MFSKSLFARVLETENFVITDKNEHILPLAVNYILVNFLISENLDSVQSSNKIIRELSILQNILAVAPHPLILKCFTLNSACPNFL